MTPLAFAARIGAIAGLIQQNADEVVRKAALAALSEVVPATPVDTGRARLNWQVGLGKPIRTVKEAPGRSGGAAERAMREAANKIENYSRVSRGIYISNNIPYIRKLNDGWSKQAPAGFIEKAIKAGIKQVRGAKLVKRK